MVNELAKIVLAEIGVSRREQNEMMPDEINRFRWHKVFFRSAAEIKKLEGVCHCCFGLALGHAFFSPQARYECRVLVSHNGGKFWTAAHEVLPL